MADLDDFFAKKDKKKSKSMKKFTTADEIAKKLEDNKQKPEQRPKKEKTVQDGEEGSRQGEEEEWKEYEETVKDYSGLKIQPLVGANRDGGGTSDGNASEEGTQDPAKVKGPWKKQGGEPEPAAAAPAPPPEPEKRAPAEDTRKAYVPPMQRVRAPEPLRRNQAKHAPDIHNDDYFPELGAGRRAPGGAWSTMGGAGGATGGGARHATAAREPLALNNRFNTLHNDS